MLVNSKKPKNVQKNSKVLKIMTLDCLLGHYNMRQSYLHKILFLERKEIDGTKIWPEIFM